MKRKVRTVRQQRFIQELPKCNYNVSKAMKKAGYTDQTSVSGFQYNTLRKITREFFDPEQVKEDANKVWALALKEKDITNLHRNLEFRSKVLGMIVDKTEIDNKNPEKVVVNFIKSDGEKNNPENRITDELPTENKVSS